MGVIATELKQVLPGVFQWSAFSPEHKVELTSHAVLNNGQLYIFDPIELAERPREVLLRQGEVAAVILTNENHERSAGFWREWTRAKIWSAGEVSISLADVQHWPGGQRQWLDWELLPLPGGPAGETAFYWRERSLVVLGDAVFNLSQHGFDILPEKYCQDHDKLREGLVELTKLEFQTALLAHGRPLLADASNRVRKSLS